MNDIDRALSVRAAAEERPDAVAVAGERSVTWAELASAVAMRRRDIAAEVDGRRPFALVGRSMFDGLVTLYAAFEARRPVVLLHPRWTTGEQRRFVDGLRLDRWREPAEPLLAVVPTSGSTGGPKGVALSRRAVLASAAAHAERFGWHLDGRADRWLLSLPVAHVGGLSIVTRCLAARATVVLPPPDAERFEAAQVRRWLDEHGVTLLSLVPTMLRRLLDLVGSAPASLRLVLVGGAAMPPGLLAEAAERGWPVAATYGLTEACSQVASQRPLDVVRGLDGAELLDGVEARVSGDGVLELRGPMLMNGYLPGEPEPWAPGRGLDAEGWLRTGDLARLDGRRLRVLGRADEVIVTGGENVHPGEVEAVLLAHPAVSAACVVGVDDPQWGRAVAAAVAGGGHGPPPEVEALRGWLRGRLAPFKVPRRWLVVEELPVAPSGKVDRRGVARRFGSGG